jgi:hypothetical protein
MTRIVSILALAAALNGAEDRAAVGLVVETSGEWMDAASGLRMAPNSVVYADSALVRRKAMPGDKIVLYVGGKRLPFDCARQDCGKPLRPPAVTPPVSKALREAYRIAGNETVRSRLEVAAARGGEDGPIESLVTVSAGTIDLGMVLRRHVDAVDLCDIDPKNGEPCVSDPVRLRCPESGDCLLPFVRQGLYAVDCYRVRGTRAEIVEGASFWMLVAPEGSTAAARFADFTDEVARYTGSHDLHSGEARFLLRAFQLALAQGMQ